MNRIRFAALLVAAVTALHAPEAVAQLGKLLSPGPLSLPHAKLEGAANCEQCHEKGRQVSATRCLRCHQAVARRIAAKKGVHRNVQSDCVSCHIEHAGRDAELRPFDPKTFDHRAETGFALDGHHAIDCARCHRTRSYLGLDPACGSCHNDSRFNHARTNFPLTGAHRALACAKCHPAGRFSGLQFRECTACHKSPHRESIGSDCHSCHDTASWKVTRFDHARTGTALHGRHLTVPCAKCHVRPATQVRLKLEPCAACHRDPHKGAFRQDCGACHNENGFKGAAYDHGRTRFPLDGKHRPLVCSACHKTRDFKGLQTDCVFCHKDPHAGQLGRTCVNCHTTSSFRVSRYEHPRFPDFFAGQHATLRCEQCHRTKVFKDTSMECVTCHRDPHQGAMPRCTECHTVAAPKFAAVLFSHDRSRFVLTGRHRNVPCRSCHKDQYAGTPSECASCHKDPHVGQLGAQCQSCHTTDSFAVTSYTHRNPGAFFRGTHATTACRQCHKDAAHLAGTPTACASCHRDPHQGQLGTNCDRCHAVDGKWSNASRAFHKSGLFPLEGSHLGVPCGECHLNGVVQGTPHRCFDCHWIRRQDDKYRTRLGNECEECHRPGSWAAVNWDHAARTGFPLTAPHRALECDQCHVDHLFRAVSSDCGSCHEEDYRRAHDPDHVAAGFPLICQLCHRPGDSSWRLARFDHTTFPLAGVHQSQTCGACHPGQIYAGTPRDCNGCHAADYDRAASPHHAAAGFSRGCDSCHRYTDPNWHQVSYAHTLWPLLGSHTGRPCSECHSGNVYAGLRSDCASCHRTDYDRSTDPGHVAAGFPLVCELCHRVADSTWQQGRFDHTTFPLGGRHLNAACTLCHRGGVYAGTPRVCAGCHQPEFDATTDPSHAAAGFAVVCDPCHRFTDSSWRDATYDHITFAILGVHASQPCNSCHRNNVYAGTSRLCSGCHLDRYTASRDPNHVAAAFPTTCDLCHKYTDTSWDQGVFSHTTFALAGVHATRVCADCHINGVYAGTPRTCAGCHLNAYNSARDPNHVAASFPTTCDTCHKYTDTSWDQGIFNHATFLLAGVHATRVCADCHVNGVYAGTSRTCAGCHMNAYNSARDPNHVAASFPTTCDTCHKYTDTSWDQGVFNHTTFALAGVHATRLCADCHINGVYAGTPRSCSGCHLNAYNSARDPNHVAASFPTTCDTCHKYTDASWDQGIFRHTTFPLAGVHATRPCADCHINGVYAGTPRSCSGCHLNAYHGARDPNHVAAGFPTTCDTCHRYTDTSWDQGVFNHTWFPIRTGPHSGLRCSECHLNPASFTLFSCTTCHDRGSTDGDHREVSGYRYDSAACYACHPQGRAD